MDHAKEISEGKGGRDRIGRMAKIFVGTKILACCMDPAECCSISINPNFGADSRVSVKGVI
jgi:hypothetical protein